MPSYQLLLKVGAPIIILRSLDPPKVTNGTRCIVTSLSSNIINAKISSGRYKGEEVTIPRIPLIPSDSTLPFQFRRLQFPIPLCFAMTINKSQGQSLKAVGINLTSLTVFHPWYALRRFIKSRCAKFDYYFSKGRQKSKKCHLQGSP